MPSAVERRLIARLGAQSKWARYDPREGTAAARAVFQSRWERDVDPDGTLQPAERARRADSAKKAYYTRLALLSAQARRRRK